MSHAHHPAIDLSESNTRLGSLGLNIQSGAGIVGIAGLLASLIIGLTGAFDVSHTFFMKSYIQNYIFVLSISLGAFFFVFIQHLTRAGWSSTVRRTAEVIAANLVWSWVGLLPLLALWVAGWFGGHGPEVVNSVDGGHAGHGAGWGPGVLFPWADMEAMKAHNIDEYNLVSNKTAYLNAGFFWVRAVCYVVFWGVASSWFLRTSIEQDRTKDPKLSNRMQMMAAPAAILFGLTITFAIIDWVMSLSPAWFSTMFGVYFFAACCTGGFAMIIIVLLRLQEVGRIQGLVTKEHYQDLGKMLFGFGMIFWAYIAFSQYMLIWYANIPEETGWFLARQIGGWGMISLALLFGHFAIPFVALISKWTKRISWYLLGAAIWMLIFHWLDMFWLVMPVVPEDAYTAKTYMDVIEAHEGDSTQLFNPLNFTMLSGCFGIFVWLTIRRLRKVSLVAAGDPRLKEGIGFENQ
jgi:hypothetical protein